MLSEDAFVSSDSAESVTEGIDAVAVPVARLAVVSPISGEQTAGIPCQEGETLLILDCEGGNNAMAPRREMPLAPHFFKFAALRRPSGAW